VIISDVGINIFLSMNKIICNYIILHNADFVKKNKKAARDGRQRKEFV